MKHIPSRILVACALLLATLSALPKDAAAEQTAKAFLEQRHTEVVRVLRTSPTDTQAHPQREAQLDTLLGQLLNYEELSKRALRDHWAGLVPEKQAEFVDLLRRLVQRSYRRNMQTSLDFSVSYVNETTSNGDVTVHTLARSKKSRRAPEVSIDYALSKTGSEWRVFDVVTDGVSMVTNYRSQFNRIIRKDGWEALLGKMRARLQDGADF
jgi:phospholipid transport system substrate-binding protein